MISLAWMSVGVLIVAQATAEVAPTKDQIARALEQLGAPSFEARQAATDLLWRAGSAAETELREAAKSTDPEVRTRAAALLTRLQLGLRPDTPPEVAALIDQFRYAETTSLRGQALAELQAKGHWQAILTLIRAQHDPDERRVLATVVAGEAGKIVRPLVERGELAQAQQVLELVAISEAGIAQLTSFLVLTGGLDRQIEALRARLASQPRDEDWIRLAYLLRAKGDLPAAIEAAGRTSDLFVQANLLAEARRFSEAGAIASELFRKHPTRLETAAFAATFYRLAGNDEEHQQAISALLKAANIDWLKENNQPQRPADPFGAPASNVGLSYAWTAAETLMINERFDDALPILRKINPRFAHTIYMRQHRHREALEFVNVAADKTLDRDWLNELPATPGDSGIHPEGRFALAAQVARQLRELGHKEQVDQIVESLRSLMPDPRDQGRQKTTLANLSWQLGQYDGVARDAADAIAAGAQPATVFAALLKQQGPLATAWYEQWIADDSQADRQKTFAKALWLVVAQPPRGRVPDDWRELVGAAHAAAEKLEPKAKARRLVLLGQTSQIRGDRELARQFFTEAAELDPTTAIRAGDLALADSNWTSAAKLYETAARAASGDAIAAYLYGYALSKAGEAERGPTLVRLATLTALAPEARLALAVGLSDRGLKEEAKRQFELVRCTALPDSPPAASAAQMLGNLAAGKEPLLSAESWEQLLLHVLNPSSNFSEADGYLTLLHIIHRMRATAAMSEGQADKVTAELDRCNKLLPGDVRLTVEIVSKLSRAGLSTASDQLFDRGFAAHELVLKDFPRSATYLNNAAWLCARAQRKLDTALMLIEKALALSPDEPSYHDTLAEVQFQRGDREAALTAARKAAELAPDNKLFARRLKHFQDDELKSLDTTEAD
jgi:tetratricopeptide repeat protein